MAFTQFSKDMSIISKLSETPNVDDGLSAGQLQDKFDEGGKAIKEYINGSLLPELEGVSLTGYLAAGPMVLSSHQYGDELPAPGIPGRIFFKRVT
ncbi:MAG: hypothetical protein IKL27_06445 [Oscillospiraceae bacterium]|nr:hypothetical protein [Oscillospiraceae bacterium]